MQLEKRPDGWWIVGVPMYRVNGESCDACGPYKTRDEAEDDRRGLVRFWEDNPQYRVDELATVNDCEQVVAEDTQDEPVTVTSCDVPTPSGRTVQRSLWS